MLSYKLILIILLYIINFFRDGYLTQKIAQFVDAVLNWIV